MRICNRCILPEQEPDISLDESGTCSICRDFENREKKRTERGEKRKAFLESDLIKLINKYKGRGKYNCLVMCSGGKDSTMSLYYAVRRYKLNPLSFTFDHGFENSEALENIRKAVNILKVDWLYHKTEFMKEAFGLLLSSRSKAPICHLCAIWYMQLTYDIARRFDIPLIIAGWTKGQAMEGEESGSEYQSMSSETEAFIVNTLHKIPKYKSFPRSMREAGKEADRKYKTTMLSPHWFMSWDSGKIRETLLHELEWNAPTLSYPKNSTNCLLNFLSVYLTMKHFKFTHYHIEISRQIRLGETSRQKAYDLLQMDFERGLLEDLARTFGCDPSVLDF